MSIPLKSYKNRLLFILLTSLSVETYASADLTFTIDNYPVTLKNVNRGSLLFKQFIMQAVGVIGVKNEPLSIKIGKQTTFYLGDEMLDMDDANDGLRNLFELHIENNVALTTTKPNKNSSSNDDKDKNNGKKKSGNNGNDGNINNDNQQNGQGGLWANHKKTIIGGTAGVLFLAILGIFLLHQSREEEEEKKVNKASLA